MPVRTAQPRKVSWRVYWERKLRAAPTLTAKLGEACDQLRAAAKSHPDTRVANQVLNEDIERLVGRAIQLKEHGDRVRRGAK